MIIPNPNPGINAIFHLSVGKFLWFKNDPDWKTAKKRARAEPLDQELEELKAELKKVVEEKKSRLTV